MFPKSVQSFQDHKAFLGHVVQLMKARAQMVSRPQVYRPLSAAEEAIVRTKYSNQTLHDGDRYYEMSKQISTRTKFCEWFSRNRVSKVTWGK
jgi:hypothetical protein